MELYLERSIKGIFLLILAVMGNFIAETLGCRTQKLLNNNMFAKHFVGIFILYFAIDFSTTDNPNPPVNNLILALGIYFLFILFTKMNMLFTVLVFFLLTLTYTLNSYINYYKTTDPKNPIIEKFSQYRKKLYTLIFGLILLGFGLYFVKQRKAHSKNWSTTKFLFGVKKCASSN